MIWTLDNFYHSSEWRKFRKIILLENTEKHNGVLTDEETGKAIINVSRAIVHHKKYLTEANVNDVEVSLNPSNVEVVDIATHNLIHDKLGFVSRHIYITRDQSVDKAGYDCIVDWGRLHEAIGGSDGAKRITYILYSTLCELIEMRVGKLSSVLVIYTGGVIGYNRLKERLNAEELE